MQATEAITPVSRNKPKMSFRDKLTPKTTLSSRIELKSKEKLELKSTRTKSELANKNSSADKSSSEFLPVNEKRAENLVSEKASNVSLSSDTVEATVSVPSSDMSLASDAVSKRVSDEDQGEMAGAVNTASSPLEGMPKPDLLQGQ